MPSFLNCAAGAVMSKHSWNRNKLLTWFGVSRILTLSGLVFPLCFFLFVLMIIKKNTQTNKQKTPSCLIHMENKVHICLVGVSCFISGIGGSNFILFS